MLIPIKDNSSLFHEVKGLLSASTIKHEGELTGSEHKVIVLDAMVIVNSIQTGKDNDIKLFNEFAAEFINRVQLVPSQKQGSYLTVMMNCH